MDRIRRHAITALRWSERYTKTDMVYLASGSFWLLSSQIANICLSFFLLWCFTNLLSPEVFGQYRFITASLGLLALSTVPGMKFALTRSVARGDSGTLWPLLRSRIKFGYIGSILAVSMAGYYFFQDNFELGKLFVLLALFVPFTDAFLLYEDYLNGFKKFKFTALLHFIQRTGTITITVAALLITHDIFYIVLAYLTSRTVAFYLALLYVTHRYPPNQHVDPHARVHGLHLSVMGLLKGAVTHGDKVLLWHLAGPVSVAQFAVAYALPNELQNAINQLGRLALPKLSTHTSATAARSFLQKLGWLWIALALVAGLYFVSAPYLFHILLPQYSDSIWYSQLLGLLILTVPAHLLRHYFVAQQDNRSLYMQNLLEPLLLFGLYAVLIPNYGVLGLVLALLITNFILAGIILFLFSRNYLFTAQ